MLLFILAHTILSLKYRTVDWLLCRRAFRFCDYRCRWTRSK